MTWHWYIWSVQAICFCQMSLTLSFSDASSWLDSGYILSGHTRKSRCVPFLVSWLGKFLPVSSTVKWLLFSLLLTVICGKKYFVFICKYVSCSSSVLVFTSSDFSAMNQLLHWCFLHGDFPICVFSYICWHSTMRTRSISFSVLPCSQSVISMHSLVLLHCGL